MLKKYKNAFLTAIQEVGLEPSMFEAEEGKDDGQDPLYGSDKVGRPILTIKLKNSPLKFLVGEVNTSFHKLSYRGTFFAPTFAWDFWHEGVDASKVLDAFKEWLEYDAKKYIEDTNLPDYWSQLKMYGSLAFNSKLPDENESKFTEEEKETVRESVKRFRTMIAEEFKPTPEQSQFINERLNYLAQAVDRLNRFDWNGLAISVVVNIAINLSVDTERGRVLYTMFKAAFQATTKLLQ
jgi:hypothetical protein